MQKKQQQRQQKHLYYNKGHTFDTKNLPTKDISSLHNHVSCYYHQFRNQIHCSRFQWFFGSLCASFPRNQDIHDMCRLSSLPLVFLHVLFFWKVSYVVVSLWIDLYGRKCLSEMWSIVWTFGEEKDGFCCSRHFSSRWVKQIPHCQLAATHHITVCTVCNTNPNNTSTYSFTHLTGAGVSYEADSFLSVIY